MISNLLINNAFLHVQGDLLSQSDRRFIYFSSGGGCKSTQTCLSYWSDVCVCEENEVEAIQKFAKRISPVLIHLTAWPWRLQCGRLLLMM